MNRIINIKKIRNDAEEMYRNNDFFCSEAVVASIRNHIDPDMPIEAISMASGFPIGVGGSKCICGAISGGVMCLGYFFGRTQAGGEEVNNAMRLSMELQNYFKENNKVACCSILTKDMELGSEKHMEQCIRFTGEIAEKTAEIITRELNIDTK